MPYFSIPQTIQIIIMLVVVLVDCCYSQEVSKYFYDLPAGLLVDSKDLIIYQRSKHTMHAIF